VRQGETAFGGSECAAADRIGGEKRKNWPGFFIILRAKRGKITRNRKKVGFFAVIFEFKTDTIAELGQTGTGRWYPKIIERWVDEGTQNPPERKTIETVYLETEPQFPERIFEPDNLPK